jgi:hypothetical protein
MAILFSQERDQIGLLTMKPRTDCHDDQLKQSHARSLGDRVDPVVGHYAFWLNSTPIEDVKDSKVPLFVAQGSRDDTTLPADLFALEAIRQQPDRPIRYVVIDKGDHAFATPEGQWRVAPLFADFLSWALDPKRETSVDVLK